MCQAQPLYYWGSMLSCLLSNLGSNLRKGINFRGFFSMLACLLSNLGSNPRKGINFRGFFPYGLVSFVTLVRKIKISKKFQ